MWSSAPRCLRTCLFLAIVSSCLVSTAEFASANPIVGPPINPIAPIDESDTTFRLDDDPVSGLIRLTLLNMLVNTALFSMGFLLVVHFFGSRSCRISSSTGVFFMRYVSCALTITVVGAFVDYFLLTKEVLWSTYGVGTVGGAVYSRVIYVDPVNWLVACLLIFLSILAASVFVLGMSARLSLPIAAGMTLVNPVWWWLIYNFGEDVAFLTLLFGILASPILVAAAVKWHASEYRMRLAIERGAPS